VLSLKIADKLKRYLALALLLSVALACGPRYDSTNCDGILVDGSTCLVVCSEDVDCLEGNTCVTNRCHYGPRPTFVSHIPSADQIAVPVDISPIMTFSTEMEQASTEAALTLLEGEQGVSVSETSWDATSSVLTLTLAESLSYGALYTLSVGTSAQTVHGVPPSATLSFDFRASLEPILSVSQSPQDDATDVALLPLISFEFAEPMALVSVAEGASLVQGEQSVALEHYLSQDLSVLYFMPKATLAPGVLHTFSLQSEHVASKAGAVLKNDSALSWTTASPNDSENPTLNLNGISGVVSQSDLDEAGAFRLRGSASDSDTSIAWVGVAIFAQEEDAPAYRWPAIVDGDTWSFDWQTKGLDPLPEGTYKILVEAADMGGNTQSAQGSMEVDLHPPDSPTLTKELPTTWKFKHLSVSVQVAAGEKVGLSVDGQLATGSPFAADAEGGATLQAELPTKGAQHEIAVWAEDSQGNASSKVAHQVTRSPYTCLIGTAGFPLVNAEVVADSLVDDEKGAVTLRYILDTSVADDTNLNSLQPAAAFGLQSILAVQDAPALHALFRVSDAFFPTCATLSSAKLIFKFNGACPNCDQLQAHQMLVPWQEFQASWTQASSGVVWGASGLLADTDHRSESTAAVVVNADSATFDVTVDAQAWLAKKNAAPGGVENHGVVLKAISGGDGVLHSTEASDVNNKPILELSLVEAP
jgi:hypothetical protein